MARKRKKSIEEMILGAIRAMEAGLAENFKPADLMKLLQFFRDIQDKGNVRGAKEMIIRWVEPTEE